MSSHALSLSAAVSPLLANSVLVTPAPTAARGAKAAGEFEAQLIGSLIESMEKTFATLPGQDSIPGSDDYNYLGTQALAQGIEAQGGFGIATMITRYLTHGSVGERSDANAANPPGER